MTNELKNALRRAVKSMKLELHGRESVALAFPKLSEDPGFQADHIILECNVEVIERALREDDCRPR